MAKKRRHSSEVLVGQKRVRRRRALRAEEEEGGVSMRDLYGDWWGEIVRGWWQGGGQRQQQIPAAARRRKQKRPNRNGKAAAGPFESLAFAQDEQFLLGLSGFQKSRGSHGGCLVRCGFSMFIMRGKVDSARKTGLRPPWVWRTFWVSPPLPEWGLRPGAGLGGGEFLAFD